MADAMSGEVVVITGASAGIGAAAAHKFAAMGATVVLAARRREPLDIVAAEITKAGGKADVCLCDVAVFEDCERLIASTVESHGRMDVLVNNAGMHLRGEFDAHDAAGFAAMADVNFRGPLVLMRLAWSHLLASPRGAVVNVASVAGLLPVPTSATYSGTKNGLRALSRSLAGEWQGRGITISVVNPGPVATGFILDDIDGVSDITFSQPMSTAEQVADDIVACALDGRMERTRPWSSGVTATIAHLVPRVVWRLRPMFERKGRKAKAKWIAEHGERSGTERAELG